MTHQTESQAATGAESIHWDLTQLYSSKAELEQELERVSDDVKTFANIYREQVSALDTEGLAAAMQALEQIQDRVGRAFTYAYLNWSTDTGDAKRGALLQKVRETYSRLSQQLLFFELEWIRVDDDTADRLMEDPLLERYAHYLEVSRLEKHHVLSEPEEKILSEKSITGRSAWNRFFDETLGASRYSFEGADLTQQQILSKLYDPDRKIRRGAALAFTQGLSQTLRTLTYVFNTILADKASTDRLRNNASWISDRNRSNEVADANVEALIASVTGRYDLSGRYYALKARLLGVDEMMDYDRYAPLGESDTFYNWNEARDLVLESYTDFHKGMGNIARRFFDDNWIDAALHPGKRGGAFSHGAVPSAHPYILMNYTGKIRDVQTLAHEMGHGVHQYLSRTQGIFHADTPLTTAETASVFGEMLVFQKLLAAETDPKNQLAMLIGKIDDTMATVFRQVSMNRFEDRIHTARREEGELESGRFSTFWIETQQAMFGQSVTLGEHYNIWWSYIPHFLHSPGYVYAYAFGELLVMALYNRYREEGGGFAERYVELLAAGGSDWPHRLVGKLGVDLTDLGFWNQGLDAIEAMIAQAEELSRSIVAP